MRLVMILVLFALAGCTSQHLGKATGQPFQLNKGDWTPTAEDLAVETID
jgi:hypothetical protein